MSHTCRGQCLTRLPSGDQLQFPPMNSHDARRGMAEAEGLPIRARGSLPAVMLERGVRQAGWPQVSYGDALSALTQSPRFAVNWRISQ